MTQQYRVDITAKDKTAQAVASAEKRFARLSQPLVKFSESARAISGGGPVTKAIDTLLKLGKSSAGSAAGLAEAAAGAEGLGGAALVAGGVLGSFAAIAGIAALAAFKFGESMANTAAASARTAELIGLPQRQMEDWVGAAAQVGIAAPTATAALNSLGNAIYSAKWSGNNTVLAALNSLHLQMRIAKDGTVDVTNTLIDLSRVFQGRSAQFQQKYAAMFGVTDLLPLLREGPDAVRRHYEEADRSVKHLTASEIAASKAAEEAEAERKGQWDALKQDLAQNFVIPWLTSAEHELYDWAGVIDRLINGTSKLRALWTGNWWSGHLDWKDTAAPKGSEFNPDAAAANANAARGKGDMAAATFWGATRFFQDKGWSLAQSEGIAANLAAESRFRFNATGDSGRAFGIGQWHADRQAAFARLFGHAIQRSTLQEQLEFVDWELKHSEKRAGDRIRQARTAGEAGRLGSLFYERPADREGQAAARGQLAENMAANAPSGQVHVQVHIKGAPAGTVAVAQASGQGVTAGVRIAQSMPEAA